MDGVGGVERVTQSLRGRNRASLSVLTHRECHVCDSKSPHRRHGRTGTAHAVRRTAGADIAAKVLMASRARKSLCVPTAAK